MEGERLTFDVLGLYNGVFVMNDRQTGSIWTHFEGKALEGSMAGTQMEMLPLTMTTWQQWLELYPDTTVLSDDTPYQNAYRTVEPGRAGIGPQFMSTIINWDDRLPENTLVLGVTAGGAYRAYPLDELARTSGVVNEELGGEPIVVFYDGSGPIAVAFSRLLDGRVLTFQAEGGRILDQETGSEWDLTGSAVSGPLAGSNLVQATAFVTEWYGWAAYHPETEIFIAR